MSAAETLPSRLLRARADGRVEGIVLAGSVRLAIQYWGRSRNYDRNALDSGWIGRMREATAYLAGGPLCPGAESSAFWNLYSKLAGRDVGDEIERRLSSRGSP